MYYFTYSHCLTFICIVHINVFLILTVYSLIYYCYMKINR